MEKQIEKRIERIEVVSGKTPLHALVARYKGKEYDFTEGLQDPYRIIGYEVIKELNDAGESLAKDYVRVWIGEYPMLTITRMPRAEDDILNGGLLTVSYKKTTNMVMRRMFGLMKYYESDGNFNPLVRPEKEITGENFFGRAITGEQAEEL